MDLQSYLETAFSQWQPPPPDVVARSKYDVTLSWENPLLEFLSGELLYKVERKDKLPPWVVEYCGSRITRRIDNLEPCCPHKFRLRVIIKASAVPTLETKAIEYFGNTYIAFETLRNGLFKGIDAKIDENASRIDYDDINVIKTSKHYTKKIYEKGDQGDQVIFKERTSKKKWIESQWSELTCTSTESIGTSAICFCMSVRGGYIKQVQTMLDERPELVGIINNNSGFTPLATAIRRGDLTMVNLLLSAGAEVDQRSTTGQTPLQIAVYCGDTAIVDSLLDNGADFQARDKNDLRIEHYATDSGNLEMLRHVLKLGGDVTVRDNNGWTPLFRALQGSPTEIIEELVVHGSNVDIVDRAGLTIPSVARLLSNRYGKPRHSVLRLIDAQYPREKALANFTRLTKKISSVHTLIKPGSKPVSPCKQMK